MTGGREAFARAAEWFVAVVATVPDDAWGRPGLGEWTVKELVGHTLRACTTIETYLAAAPDAVTVPDTITYFRTALADPGVHATVAERGRQAAADLGHDVPAEVAATAARVTAVVAATPDDAVCGSAVGGMRFVDYLATRTFELTVHTCDLVAALGRDDEPPPEAAVAALAVLSGLAASGGHARTAIAALTGRGPWPPGRTVLG